MTNINTIEDLIQLLDKNPEWSEALRSRLLSRELLELPDKFTVLSANIAQLSENHVQLTEKFDQLTARVDQLTETVARLTERLDQLTARVDQLTETVARLTERLDQLTARVDQLTERLDQLTARVDQLTERLDQLTARVDQLTERVDQLTERFEQFAETTNARLDRIDNTLGYLKGAHARNAALRSSYALARSMGLRRVKTLTEEDLWNITDSSDIDDIPANMLQSFHLADLIMEATDSAGETCYIAAEISFTANGRDTERAIRNAAFLTRFTNHAAYPAVAGINRDDRIRPRIESGEVFWSQLEPDDLEAD